MPGEILVLPSDLSAEFDAVKAKISNALDMLECCYQKKLKRSLSANIEKLVQSIERADVKRITDSPHIDQEDLVVLNFIERTLVQELELSDKADGSMPEKIENPNTVMVEDISGKISFEQDGVNLSNKDKGKAVIEFGPEHHASGSSGQSTFVEPS
ncbi:hypothetical protein A2U01_0048749, partial [Trifolium medium]|nr:hypothetical protein [Trifolium medium]